MTNLTDREWAAKTIGFRFIPKVGAFGSNVWVDENANDVTHIVNTDALLLDALKEWLRENVYYMESFFYSPDGSWIFVIQPTDMKSYWHDADTELAACIAAMRLMEEG